MASPHYEHDFIEGEAFCPLASMCRDRELFDVRGGDPNHSGPTSSLPWTLFLWFGDCQNLETQPPKISASTKLQGLLK